jgi:hypothetical protein
MKTICLNCLLYTLKNKDPKDNEYVTIFFLWLSKLIQIGGLRSEDILYIHIDSRTFEFLENEFTVLPILFNTLQCPFKFIVFDPPENSLEGMMQKYDLVDYIQDIYMYCDIDIIISNPFHIITEQMTDNMIYVCKEGELINSNYSTGFSEEITDVTLPGFSAGKFAIVGKDLRNNLFEIIHSICDISSDFYTVEQPFFNRAIYSFNRSVINIDLLTSVVSFNSKGYDKTKTIFHDLAGDVGDGSMHLKKMLHIMCLYIIGHH